MRQFLLATCPYFIWAISILELILLIRMVKLLKERKQNLVCCMSLITAGLFIDAFVISLGSVLSGHLLEQLSILRFISHGVLIPLLFPICGYALELKKKAMSAVWGIALVLMAAGLAESISTVLEMKEIAGVIRYVSSASTPGWATAISNGLSYGTVLPLIITGIVIWKREKTPYIFLSGFLMFAFSALGPATGNFDLIFFISMFGELFMVLFLYLYAKKHKEKP